jgi:hypothetical protein
VTHKTYWFAPKRYGYGSGLPISWQGWVTCGLIMAGCLVIGWGYGFNSPEAKLGTAAFLLISLPLIAARTKGGWKWRWSSTDANRP